MNRVEKLIQQYCPDGVVFVPLGNIADLFRGKVISKDYIKDNEGEFPVYSSQSANDGVLGRIDTYMYDGEYLTWTTDGAYAGTVFRRSGKFNITNVCGLVSIVSPEVKLDFLYYWLVVEAPKYVYSGMGNPKLMSNVMGTISVPIPPLPIQEEIVRVLDTFIKLQTELQRELQKRKQQYNYYRDNLLSFEGRRDVQWKHLGDICDIKGRIGFRGYTREDQVKEGEGALSLSPSNIQDGQMDYSKGTYITWFKYEESPEIMTFNGDIIFCKTASVGKVALVKNLPYKATINPQLVDLKNIKCWIPFLAYVLETNYVQSKVISMAGVGSVPNISQKALSEIEIPIPSLDEQQRLVDILDRFNTLANDLAEGLPYELEKRRQQYEYYRDKLLTFKRKEA